MFFKYEDQGESKNRKKWKGIKKGKNNIYDRQFKDDIKSGKRRFGLKEGEVYEGNWENNK